MEFRLPALGEGIDSATVVNVLVKPGDAVAAGQNVVSVETDKAAVDVPAEVAGTVEQVLVKPGDKVPVGAPILKLATAGAAKPDGQKPVPPNPADQPKAQPQQPASPPPPPSGGGSKVEFALPALGEGIDSATVVNVLVKPGDAVTAGQNVIAVETDKASVDVPAEVAGTVEAVHVKPGDKVPVGARVLTLLASGGRESPEGKPTQAVASHTPEPPRDSPSGQTAQPATAAAAVAHPGAGGNGTKTLVAAGPATRRLARELGVNLADVTGSARGNRVTLDDVKTHVRTRLENKPAGGAPAGKTVADSFAHPPLPDFSKFGEVERKAVAPIRRKIAENLTVAWRTMPMVTQHDLADVTDLEAGRKRIVEGLPKGAPKVTMTVLAVKAMRRGLEGVPALQRQPRPERRRDGPEEVLPRRHRGGHRARAGGAGDPRRGPEEHPRPGDRDFGPGGEGPDRQAGHRRDARRHVHHHQPRRHRRDGVHADRQLPGGGDPGAVAVELAAGGPRRPGGAAADDADVPDLRPPGHRRGRRGRGSRPGWRNSSATRSGC